jgi:hypothetical protein
MMANFFDDLVLDSVIPLCLVAHLVNLPTRNVIKRTFVDRRVIREDMWRI